MTKARLQENIIKKIKEKKSIIVGKEVIKSMPERTMIRRVISMPQDIGFLKSFDDCNGTKNRYGELDDFISHRSKWQKGEKVWVREPAKIISFTPVSLDFEYSDGLLGTLLHVPSRFKIVPRWVENLQNVPGGCIREMARYFIKIKSVKIKKLQNISMEDLKKECPYYALSESCNQDYMVGLFINFWNSTTPLKHQWAQNPYVFVYEFERIKDGEDGEMDKF